MMQQVRADIDVSIDKHAKFIDIESANQSKKLSNIMATFSIISIACLPATVIGGLFGMNVKVPFMVNENPNHYPFMVIVILLALTTVSVYTAFHFLVFKK
jgi:Mg2+ and Co2+ transporter CorA